MNNWPNNIRNFARQTLQEWRDIADAIADIAAWIWRGIRRDFAMFAHDFRSLFAKKDPRRFATKPPDWWHKGANPVDVPDGEKSNAKEGGFKVGWNGEWLLSEQQTAAEARGWDELQKEAKITPAEYGEMLAHFPKLTNVTLAGEIKSYWLQGKKYRDIATLCGCSEQYVKYFATCFERAKRAASASPISPVGEG